MYSADRKEISDCSPSYKVGQIGQTRGQSVCTVQTEQQAVSIVLATKSDRQVRLEGNQCAQCRQNSKRYLLS